MRYRYTKRGDRLPLWAVLGAPLVGVPLMVGLLALAGPDGEAADLGSAPPLVTEPIQPQGVVSSPTDDSFLLEEPEAG